MTTLSVIVGRFGIPNRNGDIFQIDEEVLRSRMDKMVGTCVGEVGQKNIYWEASQFEDFAERRRRMETVDTSKSAGVLMGYQVYHDLDDNLIVIGEISPSSQLLGLLECDPSPTFGIRSVTRSLDSEQKAREILKLISFDYLPPTER